MTAMRGYAGAKSYPAAPSNYWKGRSGHAILAIVLHGTAGPNAQVWFQYPASQVSSHYVVDTDGTIYQCVDEDDAAWHAGVTNPDSVFANLSNPNLWTIGIEHTRDIANSSPLSPEQLRASVALCTNIVRRNPSLSPNSPGRSPNLPVFITHDQIDVGRVCPGPGFPFEVFKSLEESLVGLDDALYIQQWRSHNPTNLSPGAPEAHPVNPDAAIYRDWLARRKANDKTMGVPISDEFRYTTSTGQIMTVQHFTSAIAIWDGTKVSWY